MSNTMVSIMCTFYWIFLKASCNKQHDSTGIYYANGLTCYMVLFNYAMLGGTLYWVCAGFFLKARCNKQRSGIYYLTCYTVLFNYAMLGGTTYWICAGVSKSQLQ